VGDRAVGEPRVSKPDARKGNSSWGTLGKTKPNLSRGKHKPN